MNYNVYIDESGNTGNIELREDLQWNYDIQTHFALGAFYVEEPLAKDIEKKIIEILHKYNPKLGTEDELKSKAKYIFRNDLLDEITKLFIDNKVGFYFDIANKKYKVIMNMVEYCVYPYFVNKRYIFARNEKIDATNFLYSTLPEEQIKVYIDLCQEENDDEEKVERLVSFLQMLEEYYIRNRQKINPISDVIDVVKNYEREGLKIENLFPVKDFNNKGTKESFLPNVDAYNNIIASIANLRIGNNDTITIFHDEQKQFSRVLDAWTNYMKVHDVNINELNFCSSANNILVQIADYYTGSIIRLYRQIIEYNPLNRNDKDLLKILKPLLYNCNIVAPRSEQREFFNKCGIKMMNTPIPFK